MRGGFEKRNAHARLAADAPAHMDDTALLFSLIACVGEKKTLASGDGRFQNQRTAIFMSIDCIDLLVKRLLVGVRAINKKGHAVRVAQAFAAVRILSRGI
jgi:hypothetical protein